MLKEAGINFTVCSIEFWSRQNCSIFLSYNRNLQQEYERLKIVQHDVKTPNSSILDDSDDGGRDAEMIAEAKLLRQHKGRLEARMGILEDHNRQLEAQLHRLRQLLEQVGFHHETPCHCDIDF